MFYCFCTRVALDWSSSGNECHFPPLLLRLRVRHEVEVPQVGGGRQQLEGVALPAPQVAHGLHPVAVEAQGGWGKKKTANAKH